ncbi:MAG: metal-dependent hydrolase [Deltaproteobacteria bacterium]|nr:metal-dependent hydrolase [Deltaproteobacteria bacterium]
MQIIDSHLHTGIQNVSWRWEDIRLLLRAAGIQGAGVIPPVEDVYDRYNYHFRDNPQWQACRRRAHRYLLDLKDPEIETYPYFFVWNDFAWEDLSPEYVAVKWHRHGNEPEYHYHDPRCREFLKVVKDRGLPILLEETLANTVFFLEHLAPNIPVIIPHLGALSGGYDSLRRAGVWNLPNVYADSAVAEFGHIEDYLSRHGATRLMFGSDYPFSYPDVELAKIRRLNLPEADTQAVLGDNFRRLCRLR